ncbi:MAG: endolytic transglycosylase MltG, partial [Candidatus Aenigmatarchaeota archaeon]
YFFVVFICFLLFFVWQGIYLPPHLSISSGGSPKNITGSQNEFFSIEKGEGLLEIAENLESQGIIKNKIFFIIYVALKNQARSLQAGKYLLSSEMSIKQIAEKFISGDTIKIKITIPEGFRLKQIDTLLAQNAIQSELALLSVDKFKNKFNFLKDAPNNAGLEGFLFPDTYYFSTQESSEHIAEIFLRNFDKKLTPELRKEIKNQNKTIFEIITMASLLEKEVKTYKDKQIVAGILWKRAENNIPLQVDATITYLTGKKTTKISKQETQIDSPYNTYKYKGLPIGPICNPGLDSIKAAIYPKDSEYWYYLSTETQGTIFSKTLEQHNKAKARYLHKTLK